MKLQILPSEYTVCRLSTRSPVPEWAFKILQQSETTTLISITRTSEELSIVAPSAYCPEEPSAYYPDRPIGGTESVETDILLEEGFLREDHWRSIKVLGPLDFSLVGVLANLTRPLAEAGISVFTISTYDTDYLLVKSDQLANAHHYLELAGYTFEPAQKTS